MTCNTNKKHVDKIEHPKVLLVISHSNQFGFSFVINKCAFSFRDCSSLLNSNGVVTSVLMPVDDQENQSNTLQIKLGTVKTR